MQRPMPLAVRFLNNDRLCGALGRGCNRLRTLWKAPPNVRSGSLIAAVVQLWLVAKFQRHVFLNRLAYTSAVHRQAAPYRAAVVLAERPPLPPHILVASR